MEFLEEDYSKQNTSRNNPKYFSTNSSYKQNCYIREHLKDLILYQFDWRYWVTFTFGYKPDLDEVEDVLYNLHYRLDRRLVKHIPQKNSLSAYERTEWFLFPELKGRGLHYHGFLKFNVRPTVTSYNDEWSWLRSTLDQNIKGLQNRLSNEGKIEFKLYNRTLRNLDDLKMILYSMKEFGKGASHTDQSPTFDRFAHTIVSKLDWKPSPLYQHRSPNKTENIPQRPNKLGYFDFI